MRVKAGVVYFLLVFALGWVLGLIRELWAMPRFGRVTALLVEAVILLIAMFISVMRRFNIPPTLGSTISMGLVALAILLPAEVAGVLWVRGLSKVSRSCRCRGGRSTRTGRAGRVRRGTRALCGRIDLDVFGSRSVRCRWAGHPL